MPAGDEPPATLREVLAHVRADGGMVWPVLVKASPHMMAKADPMDLSTLAIIPASGPPLTLPEELGSSECLVLRPRRPSRTQPMRLTIGRARDCDMVVPDASVSKLHATVIVDTYEEKYSIRDEGSRNGTRVDGVLAKAGKMVPIGTLARISFGTATFIFADRATLKQLSRLA